MLHRSTLRAFAVPSSVSLMSAVPFRLNSASPSGSSSRSSTDCFGSRAVKMTFGAPESAPTTSFVCSEDGRRLAVAAGADAVSSMRTYLADGSEESIGATDFCTVSCAPLANGKVLMSASQRGQCSIVVSRRDGSIAFASTNNANNNQTESFFFYAQEDDLVMLHSGSVDCETKQIFTENAEADADVESIAEDVLESIANATRCQDGSSTVVVARLGSLDHMSAQPPATL